MGRRVLKGESIGKADKEHLHHQILKKSNSQRKTVLTMYLINTLFAGVSIFYTLGNKKLSMGIYAVLLLLFVFLVLKTDILIEHKKDEKKGTKKND
jgi:UDP-GlcNAc:undecaprenyl-phosphate GlcNAc-1-phosphate transferase